MKKRSEVLVHMESINFKKELTNKEKLAVVGKKHCLLVLEKELKVAQKENREDLERIKYLISKISFELAELKER